MIYWKLCKKFQFDHTNKWYHNDPTSGRQNDIYKLQWDFDIQIDQQISARRPDLIVINKKERTCQIVDFVVLSDHRVKLKESEKKNK